MSRYLSKFGQFGVQVRPEQTEAFANGIVRVTQEQVAALFEPGLLTPDERDLALKTWTFNGGLQEEDEVTMVPPDHRLGVFDSEAAQRDRSWTDDTRAEVERLMDKYAERSEDVMAVPKSFVPAPWPRYDDYSGTPAQLVRKLVDEGHDLQAVVVYERQAQNRDKVIAAIEEALAEPELLREEEVAG